jgi:LPS-assembly protein
MMGAAGTRRLMPRHWMRGAAVGALVATAVALGLLANASPGIAQKRSLVSFPPRPGQSAQPGSGLLDPSLKNTKEQMLVRANEVDYDYTNERVSAVGNVQIYYGASTLEADRVIYDQRTKRLHAEGNVRLTEADGKVTTGEIIDLSDDFRDGFIDSLRLEGPEQTHMAANRAERKSGALTIFYSGVYTACEPCKDDPRKPPKWQVKAARVIHDQGEKMMYFEDATLEFYGVPLAWMPYFSTPDPTAKRVSGFLVPAYHTGSAYGVAVAVPYYWALAPDYDVTITPVVTSKQGPLLEAEWRQRLINGSYTIRATGIFQLDKNAFLNNGDLPGYRDTRGSVESAGQFRLSDKWVYGWDGTLVSDKSYFQDYGLYRRTQGNAMLGTTPDFIVSQTYLQGRGDRSFFDARAMYFYGFSSSDNERQLPIVHPVVDQDYTAKTPVFGGELRLRNNLTSLTRDDAEFDPINANAVVNGSCALTADSAQKTPQNCLLRGVPGTYSRLSSELGWRRTIVDSFGEVFTPFVSARGDFANVEVNSQPGVSNFMNTGAADVTRFMPTAGVEYRYPLISVQSWGTQTIEPIAQMIVRPNETKIGALPNEDSQSLIFDASNLFAIDKYAGWDRVEGGGRLNAGVSYTAQFNRGGFVNALFGQSYSLFGLNSFAVGGPTNTGIESGLDTQRSDYVGRVAYQPNSTLTLTSRVRLDQGNMTLNTSEFEAAANFDRWTTSLTYGNYAAQPALGYLTRREGLLGNVRYKVDSNWLLLGGVRYDLVADRVTGAQGGVGYVDDCLLVALNYLTEYAYNSNNTFNQSVMLQVSLRTLGGSSVSTQTSALTPGPSGLPR